MCHEIEHVKVSILYSIPPSLRILFRGHKFEKIDLSYQLWEVWSVHVRHNVDRSNYRVSVNITFFFGTDETFPSCTFAKIELIYGRVRRLKLSLAKAIISDERACRWRARSR